jgi:hypothetical protein
LPTLLEGKRAVHGHFRASKYRGIQANFRCAVIREPIARLVSHYYFWQTMPRGTHRLHLEMLDGQLDLEEFAKLPSIRHFYTQNYFSGVSLEEFSFIGIFEEMPRAMAAIDQALGCTIDLGFENRNESPVYRQEMENLQSDAPRLRRLKNLLADDIQFYEACRTRWG